MNSQDKLTRKEFFRRIGSFTLIPLGMAWYSSAARGEAGNARIKKVKLQPRIEQGVTFKDDIIISRTDKGVNFFSSKCTHLGCRLNKLENGEIVCPCHGSRFSVNGKVMKGPAASDLHKLVYTVNKSTKEIIIDVPA